MTLIVMMDLILGETSMRMPVKALFSILIMITSTNSKNYQYHFHVDIQLFPRYLSVQAEKP